MRVKDRVNNPTSMGWIDVMINIRLAGDECGHVCEIQVVSEAMYNLRKGLGGHEEYGEVRSAMEILELLGIESHGMSWL